MKIGNFENLSQIQNSPSSASASPSVHSAPTPDASADTAHLSSLSGQVTQAASASGASDVRLDKVAAIQSALATGSYSVSAAQVASKLVDAMLDRKS